MTVRSGLSPVGIGRLIFEKRRRLTLVGLAALLILVLTATGSLAIQKHTLSGEGSGAEAAKSGPTLSHGPLTLQSSSSLPDHQPTPLSSSPLTPHQTGSALAEVQPATPAKEPTHGASEPSPSAGDRVTHEPAAPAPPKAEAEHAAAPTGVPTAEHGVATAEHAGEAADHGEHGVVLPEISPIAGVTFVETAISLMEYELHGRFLGWRPNDLVIGRFTDNINYFQLGVLEAMRFTTLRLKDSLTRMGEADTYDPDLEDALNLFMNKATLFWFPSAETSYGEAVEHLKTFLTKLKSGRRSFYYRTDNLLALISSYGDLLGNVNKSLAVQTKADGTVISWFESDDYFYYAKGVAHVLYEILKVVRVGYKDQLITIDAIDILDEILHELHNAEIMDPWIILNSDLGGFFANHRANLNAPLSEVAHLMTVMSRF